MIRNLSPMQDGISIPEVWGLSDDKGRVMVRVFVSEKNLPANHDKLKEAMNTTATGAAAAVVEQFTGTQLKDIIVECVSIEGSLRNSNKDYAVYENGQLTFH